MKRPRPGERGPPAMLRRSMIAPIAWSVVLFIAGTVTAFAQDCPIQLVAGQIIAIDGPPSQVSLMRTGRRVPAQQNSCIFFGDRLDASQVSKVKVTTGEGVKVYGRMGDTLVWAPVANGSRNQGPWDFLNQAYGALFEPTRAPPISGIGRGGTCLESPEFGDALRPRGAAVTPLASLPAVPQRVEANLPLLAPAWKADGDSGDIRVQLIRDDGIIVSQKRVCGGSYTSLALPPGALRPGERLTLRIGGKGNPRLDYPITVIAPGALERPIGTGADWAYGAWLLATGPLDVRLNAVAWISTGAGTSYGAFRILSAVLSEETYR
jgi:hypothetical protein